MENTIDKTKLVKASDIADAVEAAAEETTKVIKKGRTKAVHEYTFADQTVNLNGYVCICTSTGNEKRFYHSYLANMIEKKYDNDFSLFEKTYISREGKGTINRVNKVKDVEVQITKLYNRIRQLKTARDSVEVN